MKSGVYKITCIPTGRFYIGCSVDLKKRTRKHILQLRDGRHDNPILQRAFRKYGEGAFVVEYLEVVPRQQVVEREQFYLDTLCPFGKRGFNVCRIAESVQGIRRDAKTRRKMSDGLKRFAATEEGQRLRRITVAAAVAQRAKRTHCKRGHELTPDNIYTNTAGLQRGCRACVNDSQRRRYHKARSAELAVRTHCSAGHELVGNNITASGLCRTCRKRCLDIARAAFVRQSEEKTRCGAGHDLTLPRAILTESGGKRRRCRECRNAQYSARDRRRRQGPGGT